MFGFFSFLFGGEVAFCVLEEQSSRSSEQDRAPSLTCFPSFRTSVSKDVLYSVSGACQLCENSLPSCVFFCLPRTGMIRTTVPLCRATSRICWNCCWSQSSSLPPPIPPTVAWCPTKLSVPSAFLLKGL